MKLTSDWSNWLIHMWNHLRRGKKIIAPQYLLHPCHAGFARTGLAEPIGQMSDWVLSLKDGSRIHIHEYRDGTLRVHRDRIDPSRGPIEAATHWFTESPSGQLVGMGLAATAAFWLVSSLLQD